MSKSFKKPEKSKLKINVPDIEKTSKPEELQRTEKWRIDRLGRWTGSQQKNLMSCDAKGGKLTWYDIEKLFYLGAGALKYIYENAMERKSQKYVDMGKGTKEMQYGTRVEPLIAKATKKELKRMKVKGKMKDVGFKQFPTMPNAGVSSDSILKHKGKVVASVEMKACTNWNTHYERTFEAMDEKSKDFWQTQGQMVAWSVDRCYYVVAEPPIDIGKYLYYDGDIMDLYDEFRKECPISIQVIAASEIHQNALLQRICIAEDTLNTFLTKGGDLKTILYRTIDYYKENQDKLKKYIK
jgi:hypothetical protein